MVAQLRIPIFGLFDADPHGMILNCCSIMFCTCFHSLNLYLGFEIMLTYKYGSSSERAEGRGAYIKNLQWIGYVCIYLH